MSIFLTFFRYHPAGRVFIIFLITCFAGLNCAWADLPKATGSSSNTAFNYLNNNTLDIKASSPAVINWGNGFDLPQGDTINYLGPSFLNNVTGLTDIQGNLTASGLLAFSSPGGINIGRYAQIQAGSFIATTLGISSSDFLSGKYNFARGEGDPVGMVTNHGQIVAAPNGFILLLGGAVENTGTLTAQLGKVSLASGDQSTVTVSDNKLISVVIDKATQQQILKHGKAVKDAIKNTGTITANGGIVELTAQTLSDVFDRAINQQGIIEANSVGVKNGTVILNGGDQGDVVMSGKIEAAGKNAGETGGDVKILGKRVALTGNASVDASGNAGGGDIRIGWDATNPSSQEADQTVIEQNVRLDARAVNSGNGGTIETSGKVLDAESSNIFTSASGGGANGDWLLDPYNLTISTSPNSHPNAPAGSPFEPSGGASNLNVSTLETALANGDVTIETVMMVVLAMVILPSLPIPQLVTAVRIL